MGFWWAHAHYPEVKPQNIILKTYLVVNILKPNAKNLTPDDNMQISILRLGHRLPRDERITTHVCLVARAFGAHEAVYTGQHDGSLESSVSRVAEQWGGNFKIRHEKNYDKLIREYKKEGFRVVHLTMYGLPVLEVLRSEFRVSRFGNPNTRLATQDTKLLIIVGGEQVPKEVYELADFNVAITSQPHSEVAALAVFLDRLQNGKALERDSDQHFGGKIAIKPSEREKRISKQ